jgi:hypothetical protein
MASVPEITRLLARIADWKEGHGKGLHGERSQEWCHVGGDAGSAAQLRCPHRVLFSIC